MIYAKCYLKRLNERIRCFVHYTFLIADLIDGAFVIKEKGCSIVLFFCSGDS